MQLNAQDDGNRKFILSTLDEQTPKDSDAWKEGYKTIDHFLENEFDVLLKSKRC